MSPDPLLKAPLNGGHFAYAIMARAIALITQPMK
jgi:hypothetical protein